MDKIYCIGLKCNCGEYVTFDIVPRVAADIVETTPSASHKKQMENKIGWKNADELIKWWHNTPKQIAGSEIDAAIKQAWAAAIASLQDDLAPPCLVCGSKNTYKVWAVECDNCACIR